MYFKFDEEKHKPGTMIYYWSGRNDLNRILIDRLTKTQIVTRIGRFRKEDGSLIGDTSQYWRTYIPAQTPELEIEFHEKCAKRRLSMYLDWKIKENHGKDVAGIVEAMNNIESAIVELFEPKQEKKIQLPIDE